MTPEKHRIGLLVALLCALAILSACQGNSARTQRPLTSEARLGFYESSQGLRNQAQATATQPLFNSTPTGTATREVTPGLPTEYIGQVPAQHAWIGIATTQRRAVAFVTDGSPGHTPTFAQWFRGSNQNEMLDTSSAGKTGNDHIQAMFHDNNVTGTITMASGPSISFTAHKVSNNDPSAGLYSSQRQINNQPYTAGWIVMPNSGPGAAGTPTAGANTATPTTTTGTTTPTTTTGTATPTMTMNTATPSGRQIPRPGPAGQPTTEPQVTLTPGTSPTSGESQAGALLNTATHQVQAVPQLKQQDIQAKKIEIPNMGTFNLVNCQKNMC